MTWAWEQMLKPGTKLVLVALADHADNDGVCWPGQASIAEKCGLTRQTVVEQLSQIEALELMHSEDVRDERGRFLYKRYFLHVPKRVAMSDKPTTRHVGKADKDHVGNSGATVSALAVPYKEEPSNSNQHPPSSPPEGGGLFGLKPADLEAWFAAVFWRKYPNPKRRDKALTQLLRLKPDQAMLDAIVEGIEHRLLAESAARQSKGFVAHWPYPHRWLQERRWIERFALPPGATPSDTRCAFSFEGERCGARGVRSADGRRWWCRQHDPEDTREGVIVSRGTLQA